MHFISGKAKILINDQEYYVNQGDTVIINSGDLHRIGVTDGSTLYSCLILNIDLCLEWGFDITKLHFANIINTAEITQLCSKIEAEFYHKATGYKQMVTAHSIEFLTLLTRNYLSPITESDTENQKKTDLTRRVIKYISQNYEKDINLGIISRDLGYNRFYLSHTFTECMGISIIDHLNRTRIHKAQKMLIRNEYSISEIAELCGFSGTSYFSTAFKKATGCSPMQYKKRTR